MDADILFLGGGPAGYVGAIHAAHHGLKVIVVERNRPGGVCLFTGCIPSKAMLSGAHEFARLKEVGRFGIELGSPRLLYAKLVEHARRVIEENARGIERYLFPRAGVTLLQGEGRLLSPTEVEVRSSHGRQRVTARYVVLATGSRERWLPGWEPKPPYVVSSQEIFDLDELPERVGIVGGGVIGCEFTDLFSSLGVKVDLFELTPTLLPGFDPDLSRAVERMFKKRGVKIHLGCETSPPRIEGKEVVLIAGGETFAFDRVLLAVGRIPNARGIGLEELGLKPDAGGFVPSDPITYETAIPHLYSVGDLRSPPMLAHKASAEAVRCVEGILGRAVGKEPPYPAVVYTHPEIASVGLSEPSARSKGFDVTTGIFPLSASGRARASGEKEGFIKVVGDRKTRAILGVHLFIPSASELIPMASLALAGEMTAEELLSLSFPHPTLSEGLYEAILLAFSGKAHHL